MIGKKLSPVLEEIENAIWEHEANRGIKQDYTLNGFRAASKIFLAVVLDKMWEMQENEKMPQSEREKMAEATGKEFSKFVKTFTGINTLTLYS